MTDEQEVEAWLKENKKVLETRGSDEIMTLAYTCLSWIEPAVLYKVISHYMMDRKTRTTYKIREQWYVDRELNHCRGDLPILWQNTIRRERGLDD